MAVRINLEGVVRYLNTVEVKKLEGLKEALEDKAKELGVEPGKVVTPAIDPGQEPSGNIRSVLRFIESCTADSSAEDKATLGVLLACVCGRTGAAGLVAKPRVAAETAEGPARRRRRGR